VTKQLSPEIAERIAQAEAAQVAIAERIAQVQIQIAERIADRVAQAQAARPRRPHRPRPSRRSPGPRGTAGEHRPLIRKRLRRWLYRLAIRLERRAEANGIEINRPPWITRVYERIKHG
jgi:hypothetical protein